MTVSLWAQELKYSVGVNISNNLVNFAFDQYENSPGFAFEPVFVWKPCEWFFSKTSLGLTKIAADKHYPNQVHEYEVFGGFVKTGVFTNLLPEQSPNHHSLGVNIWYATFKEESELIMYGDLFDDYHHKFSYSGQSFAFIEPAFDICLFKRGRFAIINSIKMPVRIYEKSKDDYPVYFVPGYGGTGRKNNFSPFSGYYKIEFFVMFNLGKKESQPVEDL